MEADNSELTQFQRILYLDINNGVNNNNGLASYLWVFLRPSMTSMVDWALKIQYISIYNNNNHE